MVKSGDIFIFVSDEYADGDPSLWRVLRPSRCGVQPSERSWVCELIAIEEYEDEGWTEAVWFRTTEVFSETLIEPLEEMPEVIPRSLPPA